MTSEPNHPSSSEDIGLGHPRGYVAEKLSLVGSAFVSALRAFGLVVKVTDDTRTTCPGDMPSTSNSHAPAAPSLQQHGSLKVPGLHDMGAGLERMLQDTACTPDQHTHQVLADAMQEERMARHQDRLLHHHQQPSQKTA